MNQIAPVPTSILPAPMSQDLYRRISISLNAIEPCGDGFDVPADRALHADDLSAIGRRIGRLAGCLLPAGEKAAMTALGNLRLMMLDSGKSEAEADVALDLWVKHLADVPAFAIEAATSDFLRGDAGERGFVPKLPVFRQHAMEKVGPITGEKYRLEKVIASHKRIRPPMASPERRAEVARMVREGLRGMALAGLQAEAKRSGREMPSPPTPLSAQGELDRLMADAGKPIAPLSAELRAKYVRPDDQDLEATA